jgi:hypothetical protein
MRNTDPKRVQAPPPNTTRSDKWVVKQKKEANNTFVWVCVLGGKSASGPSTRPTSQAKKSVPVVRAHLDKQQHKI